jgi:hypothetical protein
VRQEATRTYNDGVVLCEGQELGEDIVPEADVEDAKGPAQQETSQMSCRKTEPLLSSVFLRRTHTFSEGLCMSTVRHHP